MSARRNQVAAALLTTTGLLTAGLVASPAEAAAAPKVSLRNASVQELTGSDGVAKVKAVLNRKVKRNVVVRWKAIGETAVAGEDFTRNRGRVVIRKGTKRAVISIPVTGDDLVEQTEQLRVKITKVKGAKIGKRSSLLQILDDDVAPIPDPTVIVSDGVVVEGLPGQLPVLLSAPSISGAVVQYTMTAGTATADDVTLIPGQIVFAPGQQIGSINLATTQDDETEDVENFTVTLSNATGAKLGTKSTATVSIVDDDGGASLPTLGGLPVDLSVTEGLPFTLPLTLSALPGSPVEVLWEIVPGTADATDFSALSGSTSFGATDLLKNLSISTIDDAIAEPGETATLIVSVVSGALPPAVATVPLTILDNDGGSGGGGEEPGVLPALSFGQLPSALGLLPLGSLAVPLTLDQAAPQDVTGVLTAKATGLLGTVNLASLPFTIPQGATSPLGGLAVPLVSLPLGLSSITLTVTKLAGATPAGALTRTIS